MLRRLREAKNMSQLDLAFVLRVSPCSVRNWELGVSKPQPRFRRLLAEALGPGVLTIWEDDEPRPAA